MSFEDDHKTNPGGGPQVTVTRYALGARGIDAIETTTSSGASAVYPVYDGHGNMIATLSRNGTSFTRANNREYDAWGSITSGSGGDQGYVANLGHRKDAESGLTYMRARYYEPGTGRFVSQDPAMDGLNWFVYCGSNPINRFDFTGKWFDEIVASPYLQSTFLAVNLFFLYQNSLKSAAAATVALAGLTMLISWFGAKDDQGRKDSLVGAIFGMTMMKMYGLVLTSAGAEAGASDIRTKVIATFANYATIISIFIRLELWNASL